ncbi:hypothetical protein CROQUDRAFT_94538 [Cronartium quercuum f. sp. fusiforme G11]|uniref:Uncharacterized protein n=1 Tax=Cronartium quercuum f. sp. fusiforme G11 TaxID=708437 RepID=A0A9P6TAQ9_9BASI|nr:hypothetical protein CROQUDRAFT_94538 [Cronartium quercuum f. sp. fusiforme G11]
MENFCSASYHKIEDILTTSSLIPYLISVLNACLKLSYFPEQWQNALTAIIQKHDKD